MDVYMYAKDGTRAVREQKNLSNCGRPGTGILCGSEISSLGRPYFVRAWTSTRVLAPDRIGKSIKETTPTKKRRRRLHLATTALMLPSPSATDAALLSVAVRTRHSIFCQMFTYKVHSRPSGNRKSTDKKKGDAGRARQRQH